MKRFPFLLFLALLSVAQAQSPFSFEFHGFVNPHCYGDSRGVVGGREEMMLFYPKPPLYDSLGDDINDMFSINLLAITTRLGVRIYGPDMLGATSSAYIEGDFTGATNATIDNLRLRHAYFTLDWGGDTEHSSHARHTLLAGQYWYPMVIHEIMPMTNPLNMGAPFHCYARQPQVRYDLHAGIWQLAAAATWQLDNMSQGLLNGVPTSSTLFARYGLVPELNAQLRLRTGGVFLGAAVNVKTIQPIVQTTYTAVNPSNARHSSLSYSLFGKADLGGLTVKAQTLLNNSLYEGCSLGGYLMMADTTFRDWHFNTVWVDLSRNRGHWQPGIFLGYALNNDFDNANYLHCFGRGHDIEYLWRVQPRLTYKTDNGLEFTAELEYTCAKYDAEVSNLRLSFSAVYAF